MSIKNCTSKSTNNAQNEYKYHAVFTPEDRLDRFPAVDQSVSWISRANSVPLHILLSCIPRKSHGQTAGNFYSFVF